MSRVGKHPVQVPEGVTVAIIDGAVTAKGKLGELAVTFPDEVEVGQEDRKVWVRPRGDSQQARKMWGTARAVIQNLVNGVSKGYTKTLLISGVGYRAQLQGHDVVLQLGYSHEVKYPVPEGITIQVPEPTRVIISGADKQRVGQVAAEIRGYRPPEPYKGKGIKYQDEFIFRKEGKKK